MMESCGDDEAVIWGHQGSGTDSPAVVPDAVWWVVMKLGILRVQYSLLMPTTTPAWSYWVYGVMCWIGLMILWAFTRNLLDPEAGSFQGCCNEHGCVPPDLLWKFPAFHWLLKKLTCKLDRVPKNVCPLLLFSFPPSPDVLCPSKSGKPSSDLVPVKCLVCHSDIIVTRQVTRQAAVWLCQLWF